MKLNTLFLVSILLISCSKDNPASNEEVEFREISSIELVAEMGAGWNLGNSLDTKNEDETYWGNPTTVKRHIDTIREMGFKTLRVPVTWQYHMGDGPEYVIESPWLDRVEEVVNYGLENEMFVIINIHHDDDWIIPTYANATEVSDRLGKVWTQIANRFEQYDEHLIFETLNEPRHVGSEREWVGGTEEGREVVNQYHKASVDAIRASGGNNTLRHIMVSTYAASTTPVALDAYEIPNNDERVIVSLHSYFPYPFTLGGTDDSWGTVADRQEMDAEFNKIYDKFIANGRAVVMGEWSPSNQDNFEDRLRHATYYAEGCVARGIVPVWWDNGDINGSALLNRNRIEWYFPEIAEAIVEAAKTD